MLRKKIHRLIRLETGADIALSRDDASRFLPWIIALMVYLAAVILTGSLTLHSMVNAGYDAQNQRFSVQIPHTTPPEKQQEQAQKILALVKNFPGVSEAEFVSNEQIREAVEPWFGKGNVINNLPLPMVIEGKSGQNIVLDYDDLRSKVSAIARGTLIDEHKKWISQFASFIAGVRSLLITVGVIIIGATALMVVFACKTSLKIHRSTISILHRLGAMDGYIARQFQNYAALLTFKGAFVGSLFAGMTFLTLHIMTRSINAPLFPSFSLFASQWVVLFLLPVGMSLLAALAARFSVLKTLRLLP